MAGSLFSSARLEPYGFCSLALSGVSAGPLAPLPPRDSRPLTPSVAPQRNKAQPPEDGWALLVEAAGVE